MYNFIQFCYIIAAILFILSIYGLSSPKTARIGNYLGISSMCLAIIVTLINIDLSFKSLFLIIAALSLGASIGLYIATRIKMTEMPQLVAAFHSLIGLSAVFVAFAILHNSNPFTIVNLSKINLLEMGLGNIIGSITFSGSVVAFLKLNGNLSSSIFNIPNRQKISIAIFAITVISLISFTLTGSETTFAIIFILALIVGVLLILPIGGADMPVVISMLNSYSGWATAALGLTLSNYLLIITGSLVGASGAILSYIMCKAMNRSIIDVIFKTFSEDDDEEEIESIEKPVNRTSATDVAFMMKNASSVIIVPGYGMAVASAQHAIFEMVTLLKSNDVNVKFAIHPVAGRMPGHMNVLLAESGIEYDDIFELEDINNDFKQTDLVYVIGANDITNPAAKNNPKSPIYGMPIIDVENAKTIIFAKRSLSAGYAGIDNELFYKSNSMMLFGDGKKVTEEIIKELQN